MKLYPDTPAHRRGTIMRDVAVLLLLGIFAWLGITVYEAVDALSVLGTSLITAGQTLEGGFQSAAGAMDGIPLIGDDLAAALAGAGTGSGGQLAALGEQGVQTVHDLALTLGLVVFGLPAAVVLLFVAPRRVRQIGELTAASDALATPLDQERARLLAMRAVFDLPYGTLMRYSKDPIGDLADGRYEALVMAALDDAGVRPTGGGPHPGT